MARARRTTDHLTIRRWVEQRGGRPACVRWAGVGNHPAILCIEYPGDCDERAGEESAWDAWFDAFERNELAMVMEDWTPDGTFSRLSKLVPRRDSSAEDEIDES